MTDVWVQTIINLLLLAQIWLQRRDTNKMFEMFAEHIDESFEKVDRNFQRVAERVDK
jgi:hypothetical protein